MTLRTIIVAALACVSAAGAAFAQDQQGPAQPQTPEAWRVAAETDLEALRAHLLNDTPVALDSENRAMQRWYERGYREARNRWGDADLHELRGELRMRLKEIRATSIPERNEPWPYVARRSGGR